MIPLLTEIERILLREWDPIGVQEFPTAADEYDSYALQLYGMIHAQPPSTADIEAYLGQVQTEYMGLDLTAGRNAWIAGKIAALRSTK